MEFWEFLLQKEGDRAWLPLESPKVEILEGRYRIVARSSQTNTPLEIKITQQDPADPVRRIQKRPGKTNPQGLVVVMPYTRLQPGHWEFRCTGDLMDDLLGKGWSHIMQLQVLPLESDLDWHEDDHHEEESITRAESPAFSLECSNVEPFDELPITPPVAVSPEIYSEVYTEIQSESPAESAEPVASLVTEDPEPPCLPDPVTAPVTDPVTDTTIAPPQEILDLTAIAEIPDLCLQLTQESWVIQKDQPLTLTGAITALESSASSFPVPVGKLRVRLFDPQNSKMLSDQDYPLSAQPLPIPFSCELSLPKNAPSYLVLGELALYAIAQPGELPTVLATQSFNVTPELNDLLEAIANDFSADLPLPPQATVPGEPQLLEADLSFFNIPPVTQTLFKFQSAEPTILPPQLHKPDLEKLHSAKFRLDLPSFNTNGDPRGICEAARIVEPETQPEPHPEAVESGIPETVAAIEEAIEEVIEEVIEEAPEQAAPEQPAQTEPALPQPLELVDELTGDWDEDWEIAADGSLNWRQLQQLEPATPEDRAFRSLNLQDRFINRLQTLATDAELGDWLREPAPVVPINPIDQEIVVDDDVFVEPEVQSPEVEAALNIFQAAQTVPVPQIEVPPGELVAGQPINLVVKLPKSATRVYAKLWVRDRQLRVLIEGPRWLIDFKPDGFGALKAQTTVTLPLGCMEVQFEAIALEMTNQGESDRAIVARSVISPALSAFSLEELEA